MATNRYEDEARALLASATPERDIAKALVEAEKRGMLGVATMIESMSGWLVPWSVVITKIRETADLLGGDR